MYGSAWRCLGVEKRYGMHVLTQRVPWLVPLLYPTPFPNSAHFHGQSLNLVVLPYPTGAARLRTTYAHFSH